MKSLSIIDSIKINMKISYVDRVFILDRGSIMFMRLHAECACREMQWCPPIYYIYKNILYNVNSMIENLIAPMILASRREEMIRRSYTAESLNV